MNEYANSEPVLRSVDAGFAALVTRHQRALYGYIMSLVRKPHEADDVLQEVNVVLWRKAAEFESDREFLPWACTIAYYEVLAHRKRLQRDRHVQFDDLLLRELATEAQKTADEFESRLDALRGCMEQLPERSRKLLTQRYGIQEDRSLMPEQMGTQSTGAMYTALHRIRQSLLDCIQRKLGTELI